MGPICYYFPNFKLESFSHCNTQFVCVWGGGHACVCVWACVCVCACVSVCVCVCVHVRVQHSYDSKEKP